MPGKEDLGWSHELSPTFRNRHGKYEKTKAGKQHKSLMQQKEGRIPTERYLPSCISPLGLLLKNTLDWVS